MNILDAAFNVVSDYPGGASALGPRLGKRGDSLSHELKSTGTAKFGLLDAVKVTELSSDLRILQAFAAVCGQMVVPLPAFTPNSSGCMARLADTAREYGELCTEVAKDLADGQISDNELARIDRETGELIASLHALRASLVDINQAAKPRSFPEINDAQRR